MNSAFAERLAAEGVTPEGIERLDAWLREADMTIGWNPWAAEARRKAEHQRLREATAAASLAKAKPYSGAIKSCQVSVPDAGRSVGSHRCRHAPKWVVTVNKWGDPDTLVACTIHAKDPNQSRYLAHSKYDGASANEPIEPEYLS